MKRLCTLAVSLLLCALAAATVAVAQGDPRAERERLNAADNALASRIAVKRSDLGPGWMQRPAPAESNDDWSCPGFNPDFSAFTITGKATTTFARENGSTVVSVVEIYPNRAQARGDFALGAKPAVARCLKLALERELAQQAGFTATVTSARQVRAPRLGERAVAYRIVVRLRSGARSIAMYVDVVGVHRGRSLVALMFTGVTRPLANQLRIAQRVVARMR